MTRPRRLAAALAAAAILGTGAAVVLHAGPPAAPPAAGPHRVDLALPVRPTTAPAAAGPLAALVADGAGSAENVRAAACMRDPDVLAASGWTPEQLAQLPAVAAAECPTDHDPAPAAPRSSTTPARRPASSSSPARPSTPTRTTPAAPARIAAPPAPVPAAAPHPAAPAAPTCTAGTDWDGAHCTAPQGDAERIGRQITGPGGEACTVVAVNPDQLECTPSP